MMSDRVEFVSFFLFNITSKGVQKRLRGAEKNDKRMGGEDDKY
jgi:hypothetical protein